MQRTWIYKVALVLCLGIGWGAAPGYAFSLEIDGDRISVRASQEPLQDLLKELAAYGITVRMDPDINPLVTAAFRDRDLEDGLKAVLRPHNHVFFWRPIEESDPGKSSYQLDEIHIFRPGLKGKMVNLKGASPPAAQPRIATSTEPRALAVTQVQIVANKVFVPVVIGYQGREVETSLIFDTGAGSIVLHENVAGQLDIESTEVASGRGVGGIRIETRKATLDYVRLGPHMKENLRADIIEFQGTADERYNGLLGMNFIRGLKYTIDFDNQVIKWMP